MLADAETVAEWEARLERFASREQTVQAFCKREGVSVAMLYYWRRKLATKCARRRRVVTACSDPKPELFQPVEVLRSEPVMEVEFPQGTRLQVRTSDPHVVRAVVAQLLSGGEAC